MKRDHVGMPAFAVCIALCSVSFFAQAALIVDGGFTNGLPTDTSLDSANVGLGWYGASTRWRNGGHTVPIQTGPTTTNDFTYPADVASRTQGAMTIQHWFGQIIDDGQATTGSQFLEFDYDAWEATAPANNLFYYDVYGYVGATPPTFSLTNDAGVASWTELLSDTYAPNIAQYANEAGTVQAGVDFGTGYDYIAVRFRTDYCGQSATTGQGDYVYFDNVQFVIPEPSSMALMLFGLGAVAWRRHFRKKPGGRA